MAKTPETMLSAPLTVKDRERLYFDTVLTQEFYDSRYIEEAGWEGDCESAALKARVVLKYLRGETVLDCGCARGNLVSTLRAQDISAYGFDFSLTFLALAEAGIKRHLCASDIRRLPFRDRLFDLIVCSEVLEHLPVRILDEVIPQLKRICRGSLFITLPAQGPNIEGRYGFGMDHVPSWIEDARANRTFRQLVLVKSTGLPHCGHVTLASHRWWRDKFAQHGLNRAVPLETTINYDPEIGLIAWPFCILVLCEVRESEIVIGPNDFRQLGTGWYDMEEWQPQEYVRWTRSAADCMLRADSQKVRLSLEVFGGPKEKIYSNVLNCSIEQLGDDSDELHWQVKAQFGFVVENQWQKLESPAFKVDPQKVVRVRLHASPTWIPERIFNNNAWGERSSDSRQLTVAYRRIALVPK